MNAQKRLKILIIDDNQYDQLFLSKAIQKYDENCEILIAENGKDGLNIITNQSPDLIFLDVSMPIMDGLTMLRKLKSNFSNLNPTVIAITNFTDSTTISTFFSFGISDYVVKPVNDIRVYNKLEKIFENEKRKMYAA